mmetsp:Transcript_18748/g.61307  ORF Transcript_18748/g.61307 Transcript_18748/m.61307 type:complete len:383 (+) Transcript_18748:1562-2710(+)
MSEVIAAAGKPPPTSPGLRARNPSLAQATDNGWASGLWRLISCSPRVECFSTSRRGTSAWPTCLAATSGATPATPPRNESLDARKRGSGTATSPLDARTRPGSTCMPRDLPGTAKKESSRSCAGPCTGSAPSAASNRRRKDASVWSATSTFAPRARARSASTASTTRALISTSASARTRSSDAAAAFSAAAAAVRRTLASSRARPSSSASRCSTCSRSSSISSSRSATTCARSARASWTACTASRLSSRAPRASSRSASSAASSASTMPPLALATLPPRPASHPPAGTASLAAGCPARLTSGLRVAAAQWSKVESRSDLDPKDSSSQGDELYLRPPNAKSFRARAEEGRKEGREEGRECGRREGGPSIEWLERGSLDDEPML